MYWVMEWEAIYILSPATEQLFKVILMKNYSENICKFHRVSLSIGVCFSKVLVLGTFREHLRAPVSISLSSF